MGSAAPQGRGEGNISFFVANGLLDLWLRCDATDDVAKYGAEFTENRCSPLENDDPHFVQTLGQATKVKTRLGQFYHMLITCVVW